MTKEFQASPVLAMSGSQFVEEGPEADPRHRLRNPASRYYGFKNHDQV
jgi:hypothetical protein